MTNPISTRHSSASHLNQILNEALNDFSSSSLARDRAALPTDHFNLDQIFDEYLATSLSSDSAHHGSAPHSVLPNRPLNERISSHVIPPHLFTPSSNSRDQRLKEFTKDLHVSNALQNLRREEIKSLLKDKPHLEPLFNDFEKQLDASFTAFLPMKIDQNNIEYFCLWIKTHLATATVLYNENICSKSAAGPFDFFCHTPEAIARRKEIAWDLLKGELHVLCETSTDPRTQGLLVPMEKSAIFMNKLEEITIQATIKHRLEELEAQGKLTPDIQQVLEFGQSKSLKNIDEIREKRGTMYEAQSIKARPILEQLLQEGNPSFKEVRKQFFQAEHALAERPLLEEMQEENERAEQSHKKTEEKITKRNLRKLQQTASPLPYRDSSNSSSSREEIFPPQHFTEESPGKLSLVVEPMNSKKSEKEGLLQEVRTLLEASRHERKISLNDRILRWGRKHNLPDHATVFSKYKDIEIEEFKRITIQHFHPAIVQVLQHPKLMDMYFTKGSPPDSDMQTKPTQSFFTAKCLLAGQENTLSITWDHNGNESEIYHAYCIKRNMTLPLSSDSKEKVSNEPHFEAYYPSGSNLNLPPHLQTTYYHPDIGSWEFILYPK